MPANLELFPYQGIDRFDKSDSEFIELARKSLEEFLKDGIDETIWQRYANRLRYLKVDLTQMDQYQKLQDVVDPDSRVMVNYFAVAPFLFKDICRGLDQCGILNDQARMVMEKPIGHDLASSIEINDAVAEGFQD